MTDPHPSPDLLLELAVGTGDDTVRGQVSGHLERCPACRLAHRELLDGIDLTLPAAPRVAPPPGFETAVLGLLREAGAAQPAEPRSRRWLATAAAVLLGVALGAGGASLLGRTDPPEGPALTTERMAALVADDGSHVGAVVRAYDDDGRVLVVLVHAGTPGATLTCRAVLADGTIRDLAQWRLSGEDVWVVDEPAPGTTAVELVDETGRVWAAADM